MVQDWGAHDSEQGRNVLARRIKLSCPVPRQDPGGAKVVRLAEPRTGANPSSSDAVLEYVMNLALLQSQSITVIGWNKARVSTRIPIHTNETGVFSEERRVYKPRVLHLNEQ